MSSNESFGLTQEEVNALDAMILSIHVPASNARRKTSILYALRRWKTVVDEVEGVYQFTRHEFFFDVSFRSFLKNIIAAAPEPAKSRLESVVQKLDKRFLDSTVENEGVMRGDPSDRDFYDGTKYRWWEYRVPKRRTERFDV